MSTIDTRLTAEDRAKSGRASEILEARVREELERNHQHQMLVLHERNDELAKENSVLKAGEARVNEQLAQQKSDQRRRQEAEKRADAAEKDASLARAQARAREADLDELRKSVEEKVVAALDATKEQVKALL